MFVCLPKQCKVSSYFMDFSHSLLMQNLLFWHSTASYHEFISFAFLNHSWCRKQRTIASHFLLCSIRLIFLSPFPNWRLSSFSQFANGDNLVPFLQLHHFRDRFCLKWPPLWVEKSVSFVKPKSRMVKAPKWIPGITLCLRDNRFPWGRFCSNCTPRSTRTMIMLLVWTLEALLVTRTWFVTIASNVWPLVTNFTCGFSLPSFLWIVLWVVVSFIFFSFCHVRYAYW